MKMDSRIIIAAAGIAVVLAVVFVLLQKAPEEPGPIGGERDEHGCLVGAGYSWDEDLGACVRTWEIDQAQREGAKIAVDALGRQDGLTITHVEVLKCPGCYEVCFDIYGRPKTVSIDGGQVVDVTDEAWQPGLAEGAAPPIMHYYGLSVFNCEAGSYQAEPGGPVETLTGEVTPCQVSRKSPYLDCLCVDDSMLWDSKKDECVSRSSQLYNAEKQAEAQTITVEGYSDGEMVGETDFEKFHLVDVTGAQYVCCNVCCNEESEYYSDAKQCFWYREGGEEPPCRLTPDPGSCKAYMPRYYYNWSTNSCEEFIWGGCGGVVPFETLEECQGACE